MGVDGLGCRSGVRRYVWSRERGRGSVERVVGCNLFVTFVADTPM